MVKIENPKATFKEEKDKVLMELSFDRIFGKEKSRITIHNIILDSANLKANSCDEYDYGISGSYYYTPDNYKLNFDVIPDNKGNLWTIQIETKNMTLKDIKRQLGYKINLVSE